MQLKELNHDNIQSFIGACIEPGHICYLMQRCTRGTVQVCSYMHRWVIQKDVVLLSSAQSVITLPDIHWSSKKLMIRINFFQL